MTTVDAENTAPIPASRPLSWYFAIVTAVLLTIPIFVGNIRHLPIIPQWFLFFLILPVFLQNIRKPLNVTFVILLLAGLVSLIAANFIGPDPAFNWHVFFANTSELLLWNLFALSFVFLGKKVADRWGLKRIVKLLAVSSTVFLVVIAMPLIVSGTPVRILSPIDGTASLNVHFLGFPIYASYGVNSLVPLLCLQAAIICASIYVLSRYLAFVFTAGLMCAVYLTIGSENRASQLSIALLVMPICWIIWRQHRWPRTVLVMIAFSLAFALLFVRGIGENRMAESVKDVTKSVINDVAPSLTRTEQPSVGSDSAVKPKSMDAVSTGRITIWRHAFNEWLEHPIIGNGFSTFGRYGGDVPDGIQQNTTAHFYYLNELWKGGLTFFIPLLVFIYIAVRGAWLNRSAGFPVERAFLACAVLMAFTLQSFVWDFLTLPSGGSLAWFLLGAMSSGEPSASKIADCSLVQVGAGRHEI
jgi:hypothetical protein